MTRKIEQLRLIHSSPVRAAKASGLRYVIDSIPGITRRKRFNRFAYYSPSGKPLRNPNELRRFASLAIPPAWQNVWISPIPNSHLQATGRDARGRKQYRYHPRWCNLREQTKYDRLALVGTLLPDLRERLAKDLTLPGLPRVKVIATMVKLLETTFIRIGNIEYARENNSFGLTTLRNRHVQVRGSKIHFRFRGKSGIEHELDLSNPRLAQIVRRCQELPGQELFQYVDGDGRRKALNSTDINNYLHTVTGFGLTAKDFRTWAGTVLAARELAACEEAVAKMQTKRNIVQAIDTVARRLGNTRAVCQKCYIHPAIIDAYVDGSLKSAVQGDSPSAREESVKELTRIEAAVMSILEQARIGKTTKKVA